MRFALNENSNDIVVTKTSEGEDLVMLPKGASVGETFVSVLDDRVRRIRSGPRRVTFNYAAAAEEVGVSVKWLQRRIREGVIPSRGYGNRVWFTESDIEAIRRLLQRGRRCQCWE